MTRLDPRLQTATLPLSALAAIFADHFRGVPAAMSCGRCGHRFDPDDTTSDCPTNTVARALLYRRWRGNRPAVARLLPTNALDNLLKAKPKPLRANTTARVPVTGDLFDTTIYHRTGGTR